MSASVDLSQLGWRSFYSQQLTLEDFEVSWPARVVGVHRDAIEVLGERGPQRVTVAGVMAADVSALITVGDWVLIENAAPRIVKVLERASVISRLGAGGPQRLQLIAANVDTLFIVTSCNEEFSASRLERYLAIALQANVEPVVLLTKADLCADTSVYENTVHRLAPNAHVLAVNALSASAKHALEPWLGPGQSVAFVGSSGVGKTSLVNTLMGAEVAATAGIREADAKGRHTTTSRQLRAMPGGAWIIDVPGMRELKIGHAEEGVRRTFLDIEDLARSCRYRDCQHVGDDGCALSAAVVNGTLDERRLTSYLKLQREARHAARSVHERHEQERRFGKFHKALKKRLREERGR